MTALHFVEVSSSTSKRATSPAVLALDTSASQPARRTLHPSSTPGHPIAVSRARSCFATSAGVLADFTELTQPLRFPTQVLETAAHEMCASNCRRPSLTFATDAPWDPLVPRLLPSPRLPHAATSDGASTTSVAVRRKRWKNVIGEDVVIHQKYTNERCFAHPNGGPNTRFFAPCAATLNEVMRPLRARLRTFLFLVGLAALVTAEGASAQDFDPKGRKKPGGGKPGGKPVPGHVVPGGKPPGGGGPPGPSGGDPKGPKGASGDVLIQRYTSIVLAQPGSPFPLQRLAQLYREKDGNITGLVKDFETRAAQTGPEQYASIVTLAGVYKIDGRGDEALKTYERAIAMKQNDAVALVALARLLQDRADAKGARARYEQALALQTLPADREQTLRTLMTLALDAKDFGGAKGYHDKLLASGKGSLFVKAELARELYTRAEYERAAVEFQEVVKAAAGDNRALAPALKDLGKAQAKAGQNDVALATLRRSLSIAGQEAAVRTEIYDIIAEIYRKDQKLPLLVQELEAQHPSDFHRLAMLGSLYEETGDVTKAIATYKRALGVNPKQLDLRLKLVRLLQAQGEIDKAISEYELLVRAAPNNPTFVFELAEALIQRGDRARALRVLTEVEARGSTDDEILSRLADFYGRIGESDRSVRILTRLAQMNGADPSHIVDLGDRYFQEGNQALAVQTWKRILGVVTPRAKALTMLGDVYMEHDMVQDGLASYREALQLEPQNLAVKKQLAAALERTKAFPEARKLWEEVFEKARDTQDRTLAREARSRLVTLWALERSLESRLPALRKRFLGPPPDIESGRLIAESEVHLRKLGDAEATLRKVTELAPGDADSYLALERVLVQQNKLVEAIAVLEKLVAVDPKRARELYQRMATYASQSYRDDDAIKYAARAVELNPDDAEGHRRLGDLYRSRQDTERAIKEYREAIAKNDRLFLVYFQLADLLLARGQADEADRLFRKVFKSAPDDELVGRAARLALQLHTTRGTLESLEQELLPLAIANPQRPLFRRVLVEAYGHLSRPLLQRVREGTPEEANAARAALQKLGARAVKPLLDALVDPDTTGQRVAIDILTFVENKGVSPSLLSFATGGADTSLRARAMIACGNLRDVSLLPRFEALLFPKEGTVAALGVDQVTLATAWAIARTGSPRALPILRRLLSDGTPDVRAIAALGLAQEKDRSAEPRLIATLGAIESGSLARSGAALALGDMHADAAVPELLAAATQGDLELRRAAIEALSRIPSVAPSGKEHKSALPVVIDALFVKTEGSPRTRKQAKLLHDAALFTLTQWTLASQPGHGGSSEARTLPIPDDVIDAEALLTRPLAVAPESAALAFTKFRADLEQGMGAVLATSSDRISSALATLGTDDLPIFGTKALGTSRAEAAVLRENMTPMLLPLAKHADRDIRSSALTALALSDRDEARKSVAKATEDSDEAIARLALSLLAKRARPLTGISADVVTPVSAAAHAHKNWALRVLALEALGTEAALAQAGPSNGAARESIKSTLSKAATSDPFALVRETALGQLQRVDAEAARSVASAIAKSDAEPRVRALAARIAGGSSP